MPSPDMIAVISTSVASVGYQAATQELFVRFKSGRTYVYLEVPAEVYGELLRAESKGRYLNQNVKPRFDVREQ